MNFTNKPLPCSILSLFYLKAHILFHPFSFPWSIYLPVRFICMASPIWNICLINLKRMDAESACKRSNWQSQKHLVLTELQAIPVAVRASDQETAVLPPSGQVWKGHWALGHSNCLYIIRSGFYIKKLNLWSPLCGNYFCSTWPLK